ncbi:MAG: MFS transporter [Lachnospiraceae bacterium]|nr:MFS transporter [Lachnospiraceae bacterium]
MSEKDKKTAGINRAKKYQLVLFPFNNGATNVYYILTMNYIAYHANGVLGLALMFATTMVTVMRVFDAVTDPIIGLLIDKTQGKLGKFRPYIILGNVIMAVSAILLYFGTRWIPDDMMWLKYVGFVVMYMLYVIGYTFQTACTRSGQTCITNDPKQRPLFTIFNTVASLVGMGLIQVVATVIGGKVGYGSEEFFNLVIPLSIILSAVLTVLAVIGIWEKDRPEFYGVSVTKEKVKLSEYVDILKKNRDLRMLMLAGGSTKLAFSIATNASVACMLYASMMNDYNGLFLPLYIICYVASVPFFLLSVRTAQKKGQKAALSLYTRIALICYVGVLVLLLIWNQNNPANMLSFKNINLYTIIFVICYAIGYGAYYSTADMPIPMVADCSDYETYRSGQYVPGIMGTLFSLVDKLVSSLGSTIVGLAVMFIGIETLPDTNTPYLPGMKWVVIILFCILPMLAWLITQYAMHRYSLSAERMKEIQAVNAARRHAVNEGMSLEEAMTKWRCLKDIDEDVI